MALVRSETRNRKSCALINSHVQDGQVSSNNLQQCGDCRNYTKLTSSLAITNKPMELRMWYTVCSYVISIPATSILYYFLC